MSAVFDAQSKIYEAAIPGLSQAGSHRVLLTTSLATTFEVANLTLVCAPGYSPDPARRMQCLPLQQVCGNEEYKDPETFLCKRKPAIAVSGSSTTLSIQVRKTKLMKSNYGVAEVRLTSGNVEQSAPVHWTAAVPHRDAAWLSCKVLNSTVSRMQVSGELHELSPASRFQVYVDASGLNDTRGAALYSSSIAITSTIAGYSGNGSATFAQGSDQLHLPVSIAVVAAAYLTEADIMILSKAKRESISLSGVPIGTSLIVVVQTRDCDGLVIDRPDQQLKLVLISSLGGFTRRNITLLYKECDQCVGLFEAELPGTAVGDPRSYQLRIHSERDDSVVTLSVTAFDPSGAQIAQGAILGSLAVCVLAGMLIMIYRNPKRAKQLLLSFVTNEFKMLLATISEVWDIIGAPSS